MKNVNALFSRMMTTVIRKREVSLLLMIIVICIFMLIVMPGVFGTPENLSGILLSISVESIVAVGMMILLISGAFDLSVGSVVSLSGAIAMSLMLKQNVPIPVAVLISVLICSVIGLSNGLLVAKIGVNPMITTLAMMQMVKGFAIIIAGSGLVSLSDSFNGIGQHVLLGFQMPIWYMIFVVIIFIFLLAKTKFFRKYYYIGGNEKSAHLSGISVATLRIISFIICSTLAGAAGVIMASRFGAAVSTVGQGMEMKVITAVILGGASLSGGQGTILGAVLGTAFMGLINNIMVISQVNVYWQSIIIGAILIIAVATDVVLKKRTLS